ncbi:MAG: hypothetical protein ACOY0R_18085 [Chloroflexota bacterium]
MKKQSCFVLKPIWLALVILALSSGCSIGNDNSYNKALPPAPMPTEVVVLPGSTPATIPTPVVTPTLAPLLSYELAFLQSEDFAKPPGLGYTLESSWPLLLKAHPDHIVLSITQEDITNYDWDEQTIHLTADKSALFRKKFIDISWDKPVMPVGFIILLDNVPEYGGIYTAPTVPAAFRYPVIYCSFEDDDTISLVIRPFQLAVEISKGNPAWDSILNIRVKDFFERLGKLE